MRPAQSSPCWWPRVQLSGWPGFHCLWEPHTRRTRFTFWIFESEAKIKEDSLENRDASIHPLPHVFFFLVCQAQPEEAFACHRVLHKHLRKTTPIRLIILPGFFLPKVPTRISIHLFLIVVDNDQMSCHGGTKRAGLIVVDFLSGGRQVIAAVAKRPKLRLAT